MDVWTPLYKREDRQGRKNYRPITTLTAIDKIFEHLLHRQVSEHYKQSLYHKMTAHTKNSCETTLLRHVDDWKKAIDSKDQVLALSMDMTKAFDSLCPASIVKKLEAYGFSNEALELMRSFFHKRANRIKIGGTTSTWKKMIRGCPQGSSFGPMLWNIFQNDMAFHVKNSNLSMYCMRTTTNSI